QLRRAEGAAVLAGRPDEEAPPRAGSVQHGDDGDGRPALVRGERGGGRVERGDRRSAHDARSTRRRYASGVSMSTAAPGSSTGTSTIRSRFASTTDRAPSGSPGLRSDGKSERAKSVGCPGDPR